MKQKEQESLQNLATYLSKFVRDNIEDIHCEFIPDSVMPQFNKSVRDAIYTGLTIMAKSQEGDERCKELLNFTFIPHYWEKPKLIKGMIKSTKSPKS